MTNDTLIKRCSRKGNCVHWMGCLQPATLEYFYFDKRANKLAPHCKACHAAGRKKPKRSVEPLPDGYKRCTRHDRCIHPNGSLLPATLEHFRYSKRGKYQLSAVCRLCENEMSRVKSKTPEARIKRRDAAYRYYHSAVGHPKRLEYARKQVISPASRQKHRDYARDYRNRPDAKSARKVYMDDYKERPEAQEVMRLARVRRRAREYALPDTLTAEQWGRALDYFNGCCAVCGRQLNDLFGTHYVSADHWIPLAKPGCPGTTADNIVPLCHGIGGCNNRKHYSLPEQWLKRMFGTKQANKVLKRVETYFVWVREQDSIK